MSDHEQRSDQQPVLVCGVGGITADAVLSALVAAGRPTHALVHRAVRTDAALALGAERVTVGDYDDPSSLATAMRDVESVYFVPPVYDEREPDWVEAAVRAAERAGVRKFVYHSVLHSYTPSMPHHERKARAEVVVRSSALQWTVLQPAMYAQTALRMRAVSPVGQIAVPFDPGSRFTVIDLADVALCAVEALTDARHDYAGYELAGGPAQSFSQMCAAMNRAAGEARTVVRVDPGSVIYHQAWTDRQHAEFAAMCAEYDANGLLGAPTGAAMLLGREPTTFEAVARRELTAT